ncbi:MAG: hypothetical protein HOP12_03095 [Candidatus Eisenbacteria bacterium]|uniref:Zinc finger/thioredoxin putative domain-containing protein n=1 Tax=Eiseniibacteriota bacterium TaxID=2212470 RepID=A0A849SFA6_UNCEI|nr:hypothetical protein [Candidatus Eisenbacteria bacterium]
MNVYCTQCSSAYLLPDHLLGPGGARVRCPACGAAFVVKRDDEETVGSIAAAAEAEAARVSRSFWSPSEEFAVGAEVNAEELGEPVPEHASATTVTSDPAEQLATELLDAVAADGGERLAAAHREGRVLAEFGASILDAYDEYRRRLGGEAESVAFKRVLRERWAVDLLTGVEARS